MKLNHDIRLSTAGIMCLKHIAIFRGMCIHMFSIELDVQEPPFLALICQHANFSGDEVTFKRLGHNILFMAKKGVLLQ